MSLFTIRVTRPMMLSRKQPVYKQTDVELKKKSRVCLRKVPPPPHRLPTTRLPLEFSGGFLLLSIQKFSLREKMTEALAEQLPQNCLRKKKKERKKDAKRKTKE